jgi:hypothetical protein
MKVSLEPQDYVARSADGVWEKALEAELRAQPEERRAEFLSGILALQARVGSNTRGWLKFASVLLTAPPSYARLLRDGIAVADVSSIKGWLECCVQRIGMRRVIHVLREEDAAHPERVDITTYWLPAFARTPKEKEAVKKFLADRQAAKKERS